MVRRSQSEKAESRAKILESAAGLIRANGIETTGVSEVMKSAGLTHGGFYRHFDSKDSLIAEAISAAFDSGLRIFSEDHPATADEVEEYVEQYLSGDHIEGLFGACPIPLLSADIARGSDEWKDAFEEGVERTVTKLSEGMGQTAKDDSLVLLSALVGALVIARGVGEGPLRDQVLQVAKDKVRGLLQ